MPDYPVGGGWRSRGPVEAVYADTGALERVCGTCGAAVGSWCRWPDGGYRKTPCGTRQKPQLEHENHCDT